MLVRVPEPNALNMSIRALEDTVLPLSQPIHCTDGRIVTELPIAKGTEIFMGVLGANTNKELWGEDALEWKPERWLRPLPDAVMEAPIPGVYSKSWVTVELPLYSVIEFPLTEWHSWEASGRVCKCFFREAARLTVELTIFPRSGFKFAEMEMST